MGISDSTNIKHEVVKQSPRRYHFFAHSDSSNALQISHSFDIRKKVTLETLAELATLTIEKFKALLDSLQGDHADVDPQALFAECVVCYFMLLSDLQQFLDTGIEVPETMHRDSHKHNIQKAKVDYYFNWDKRIIAKAQHASSSDALNTIATIGAAIAMAIPMVINFLVTLAPVEKAFRDKGSHQIISDYQTNCLVEKSRDIDGIDTRAAIQSLALSC